MKNKALFFYPYLKIFIFCLTFFLYVQSFSLKSLTKNTNQMTQLDSTLYVKCGDACKVNVKEKNLCEFQALSERVLIDCFKCDGEGQNCNNCYSYNEICFEMKNDENFTYQHNTNTYTIQIAKLKINQESENKFSSNTVESGIIDVNELSKNTRNIKNRSKNIKLDAEELTMSFKNYNESNDESEILNEQEGEISKINRKDTKDEEISVNNEKFKIDSKNTQIQTNKKLYGVIIDLSDEASIHYLNSDLKWKKYYEGLLQNSNVEIITKTSDNPRIIIVKKLEEIDLKLGNISLKSSFWIQDCLNYFVINKKNPEEIIIITSGNPSDEYLYLRAVNLDRIQLILTGVPERNYLSNFSLKVFKDE